MTLPIKTPKTIIKLNGQNELCLLLPDNSGHYRELVLASGKVEQILHLLLAKQSSGSATIGKGLGPTWKFLLESGLLASAKVTKIPEGQREAHLKLSSKKNSEDLGL